MEQNMKGPLRRTIAQCYQDGVIFFDVHLHNGALAILEGEEKKVKENVSAKARHVHNVLLVPGISQDKDSYDNLEVLCDFASLCSKDMK